MGMTAEEAIEELENATLLIIANGKDWMDERDLPVLEMAIDALKKQIPMRPKRIDKNAEFDGNWKKVCPTCGRMLMERITTPEKSYPRHYNMTGYCWCGQKIDWEQSL